MSLKQSLGRRILTVCAAAFAALVVVAGPASAHAELVGSTPSQGSVVASEPAQMTLRFSEEIVLRLSAVKVIGPDGRRLDAGSLDAGSPHAGPSGADSMAVDLAADARHGTFVVVWQVTAADDGHASSGTVMFAVGAASTPASVAGLGHNRLTSAVYDAGQWLGFAGLAMIGGVAGLHSFRQRKQDEDAAGDPPTTNRPAPEASAPTWPAAFGWSLLLIGTLIQVLAYAPAARGLPLTHLLDRSLWSVTLATREGHAFMARLVLLAVAAVVGDAVLRRATGPGLPLAFTVAVAATWGATGHAATGGGAPVAMVALTLHVAAMAVWVGGLFVVAVLLAGRGAAVGTAVASAVRRFSRLALASVALLVATGLYQAWREVGSVSGLMDTTYGRLLLAKVAVLLCVLGVARGSRGIVATWREAGGSEGALRRNVTVELAGASVLLLLAVLLGGNAPAR
ncbi:copper transport protein [Catenulispora sp. GP43]|uniref:copper resistance CopC/CopD family protein n=1 Tax=Catenulispora sp. GP43 TaxID=3156263 RepID=UPI0035134891